MNIHFGTDHAGYDLKEQLKEYVTTLGHTVTDHGAFSLDANDDYPDFITPCAQAVAADPASLGIILGGSGQGEAMCANRITFGAHRCDCGAQDASVTPSPPPGRRR